MINQYNQYGSVGSFTNDDNKDIIVQSLWTKPITDKLKLRRILFIAALSLTYAHRSGYRVHMHTDSRGAQLLRDFGYDELNATLDSIPDTVSTWLFAAGKYYALKAEGVIGKVHVDCDVFLKKPGVLDVFYRNPRVDAICQNEESMETANHHNKIQHMYILGYPVTTRPNWHGSMNTGIIGFRNIELADKFFANYFEGLSIYTTERMDAYYKPGYNLLFDFILEQVTLSYMSVGYNIRPLLPMENVIDVADAIGYQHLQGDSKSTAYAISSVHNLLMQLDPWLYKRVDVAVKQINAI